MPLKYILTVIVLIAGAVLSGCNAADSKTTNGSSRTALVESSKAAKPELGPETTYADGARRITTQELDALIQGGKAFIVDVRNQESYDEGHIPGSKLIPAGEILTRIGELPRDKMIVTYCS